MYLELDGCSVCTHHVSSGNLHKIPLIRVDWWRVTNYYGFFISHVFRDVHRHRRNGDVRFDFIHRYPFVFRSDARFVFPVLENLFLNLLLRRSSANSNVNPNVPPVQDVYASNGRLGSSSSLSSRLSGPTPGSVAGSFCSPSPVKPSQLKRNRAEFEKGRLFLPVERIDSVGGIRFFDGKTVHCTEPYQLFGSLPLDAGASSLSSAAIVGGGGKTSSGGVGGGAASSNVVVAGNIPAPDVEAPGVKFARKRINIVAYPSKGLACMVPGAVGLLMEYGFGDLLEGRIEEGPVFAAPEAVVGGQGERSGFSQSSDDASPRPAMNQHLGFEAPQAQQNNAAPEQPAEERLLPAEGDVARPHRPQQGVVVPAPAPAVHPVARPEELTLEEFEAARRARQSLVDVEEADSIRPPGKLGGRVLETVDENGALLHPNANAAAFASDPEMKQEDDEDDDGDFDAEDEKHFLAQQGWSQDPDAVSQLLISQQFASQVALSQLDAFDFSQYEERPDVSDNEGEEEEAGPGSGDAPA